MQYPRTSRTPYPRRVLDVAAGLARADRPFQPLVPRNSMSDWQPLAKATSSYHLLRQGCTIPNALSNPSEPRTGLLITLEGTEGCGKSTQARLLADAISRAGERVTLTREPGGTRIGTMLRELVLSPANRELCLEAEALVYAADRAQHVREQILPALAAGVHVVCDRYVDSSVAYQGAGGGLGPEWVSQVNAMATGGLQPDITFLLDVSPKVGLARRGRAVAVLDRIEQRDIDYHERVREGFMAIAEAEPRRVVVVPTRSLNIREVHRIVINHLSRRYPELSLSQLGGRQ